jgi:hypothetical protein
VRRTTITLSEELVVELKIRSARENVPLKRLVERLLRRALGMPQQEGGESSKE